MTARKTACHNKLLKMFQDRTGGRSTIAPFREPTAHEITGHERARVRRIQFIPRDLQ